MAHQVQRGPVQLKRSPSTIIKPRMFNKRLDFLVQELVTPNSYRIFCLRISLNFKSKEIWSYKIFIYQRKKAHSKEFWDLYLEIFLRPLDSLGT